MPDLTGKEASQSIKITGADSAGAETNYVGAAENGNLKTTDGLSGGGIQGSLILTTANTAYEAKVGGSPLANRKSLVITAIDANMFWGYTNGVTTSNGQPLQKGRSIIFSIDPTTANTFKIWVVCGSSGKQINVAESP